MAPIHVQEMDPKGLTQEAGSRAGSRNGIQGWFSEK